MFSEEPQYPGPRTGRMELYYELLCGSRVWVAARIVMTHGVKDLHP